MQAAWAKLNLDILIIDMPPGTGDVQLTISQKLELDGAIIVSTAQDIALIDSRKGLSMFQMVGVKILGLIENMSIFHCPNCSHSINIFGNSENKMEKDAASLNVRLLGQVPLDIDIRISCDKGEPLKKDHMAFHIYKKIAEAIDI